MTDENDVYAPNPLVGGDINDVTVPNDETVKDDTLTVDREFVVRPGERILIKVERDDDSEDDDDDEVDPDDLEDDDDDDEEDEDLLESNVTSDIPLDVLEKELERRKTKS